MAVSSESTWVSNFAAAVTPVADSSWAANLANWYDSEVTGNMELLTITGAQFTFGVSVFQAQLLATVVPDTNKIAAVTKVADAWETAILASTMTVVGGSQGPFLDIQAVGVPGTLPAAKALLITELLTAPNVADINNAVMPKALRNASLALTYLVTGDAINPLPPPPARVPYSSSSPTI